MEILNDDSAGMSMATVIGSVQSKFNVIKSNLTIYHGK